MHCAHLIKDFDYILGQMSEEVWIYGIYT